MCWALPARVLEVGEGWAVVQTASGTRRVNSLALPDLDVGDYVLVSFGMALERITEQEARELEGLWEEVARAMESAEADASRREATGDSGGEI